MAAPARTVWVFDLDNTLYPAETTIYDLIGERMTAYIARLLSIGADAALNLRERYFHQYGATVVGLVRHHNADLADFVADVHDVPIDLVAPNPSLGALIGALPGRRFVFTNGGQDYARRILGRLGFADAFERIFSLEDVGLHPKPAPAAFRTVMTEAGFEGPQAVMFEDHLLNVETAHALGFATVLIGPHAKPGGHVDFAAPNLETFLRTHDPALIDRRLPTP